MARPLLILGAVLALLVGGCGDGEESADGDSAQPQAEAGKADEPESKRHEKRKAPAKPGTEIVVGESQFGGILFDASNQAIYLFDKESSSEPACYGDCAAAWPPVLTEGEPVAGAGIAQKLLGTTKRDDGSAQVTYDGQPLYYYAHEGPGQVLCHNVSEFGGLWLVLGADGAALN